MTIDERLERLTGRHEALAQTVELTTANVDKLTADVTKLTALMAETDRFINRLAHIAEVDRLES